MDVTYLFFCRIINFHNSLILLTEMITYSEFIVAADSNHESEYDQVMRAGKFTAGAMNIIFNDIVATLHKLFYFILYYLK